MERSAKDARRTLEAKGVGHTADQEVEATAGEDGDAGRHPQLLQPQLVFLPHAPDVQPRRLRRHRSTGCHCILRTWKPRLTVNTSNH